jgi:hypothetical protein
MDSFLQTHLPKLMITLGVLTLGGVFLLAMVFGFPLPSAEKEQATPLPQPTQKLWKKMELMERQYAQRIEKLEQREKEYVHRIEQLEKKCLSLQKAMDTLQEWKKSEIRERGSPSVPRDVGKPTNSVGSSLPEPKTPQPSQTVKTKEALHSEYKPVIVLDAQLSCIQIKGFIDGEHEAEIWPIENRTGNTVSITGDEKWSITWRLDITKPFSLLQKISPDVKKFQVRVSSKTGNVQQRLPYQIFLSTEQNPKEITLFHEVVWK